LLRYVTHATRTLPFDSWLLHTRLVTLPPAFVQLTLRRCCCYTVATTRCYGCYVGFSSVHTVYTFVALLDYVYARVYLHTVGLVYGYTRVTRFAHGYTHVGCYIYGSHLPRLHYGCYTVTVTVYICVYLRLHTRLRLRLPAPVTFTRLPFTYTPHTRTVYVGFAFVYTYTHVCGCLPHYVHTRFAVTVYVYRLVWLLPLVTTTCVAVHTCGLRVRYGYVRYRTVLCLRTHARAVIVHARSRTRSHVWLRCLRGSTHTLRLLRIHTPYRILVYVVWVGLYVTHIPRLHTVNIRFGSAVRLLQRLDSLVTPFTHVWLVHTTHLRTHHHVTHGCWILVTVRLVGYHVVTHFTTRLRLPPLVLHLPVTAVGYTAVGSPVPARGYTRFVTGYRFTADVTTPAFCCGYGYHVAVLRFAMHHTGFTARITGFCRFTCVYHVYWLHVYVDYRIYTDYFTFGCISFVYTLPPALCRIDFPVTVLRDFGLPTHGLPFTAFADFTLHVYARLRLLIYVYVRLPHIRLRLLRFGCWLLFTLRLRLVRCYVTRLHGLRLRLPLVGSPDLRYTLRFVTFTTLPHLPHTVTHLHTHTRFGYVVTHTVTARLDSVRSYCRFLRYFTVTHGWFVTLPHFTHTVDYCCYVRGYFTHVTVYCTFTGYIYGLHGLLIPAVWFTFVGYAHTCYTPRLLHGCRLRLRILRFVGYVYLRYTHAVAARGSRTCGCSGSVGYCSLVTVDAFTRVACVYTLRTFYTVTLHVHGCYATLPRYRITFTHTFTTFVTFTFVTLRYRCGYVYVCFTVCTFTHTAFTTFGLRLRYTTVRVRTRFTRYRTRYAVGCRYGCWLRCPFRFTRSRLHHTRLPRTHVYTTPRYVWFTRFTGYGLRLVTVHARWLPRCCSHCRLVTHTPVCLRLRYVYTFPHAFAPRWLLVSSVTRSRLLRYTLGLPHVAVTHTYAHRLRCVTRLRLHCTFAVYITFGYVPVYADWLLRLRYVVTPLRSPFTTHARTWLRYPVAFRLILFYVPRSDYVGYVDCCLRYGC